jgi:ABC-2 type transport system permease protein
MTGDTEAIATLERVTRSFGTVTAVDRLSLSINRGETIALLGPNGAGKIAVAMSFVLPSIALVVVAASVTAGTALGWAQQVELVGLMWIATTPLTALGTLIGLTFTAEAAQSVTTLTVVVLWLLGGIFTEPANMPDTLAAIARTLPSYGIVQIGWAAATGDGLPASALAVVAGWTVAAGALAALAWRRVVTR